MSTEGLSIPGISVAGTGPSAAERVRKRGLSLFGSVPRPAVVKFAIEAAAVILACRA